MEIESMVANSALVAAREGGGVKGRSNRWREMLKFPHVSECMELAMSIERDYFSLCVTQPIGKELFYLFCRSRHDLYSCVSLLDALDIYETTTDEERKSCGNSIIQRFLRRQSNQPVAAVLKHEAICSRNLDLDPFGDVFNDCRADLHGYLCGSPFNQYQDSMFFDRFLQWKMVERRPTTKQTFRQYRQLGKGGFGEVWACQVRATGKMYACKKLDKTHVKRGRGECMALNEKKLLQTLDSRFVVSLAYAYETKHSLCMVVTLMNGGDLRFHIYKIGPPGLESERVQFYAAEVCCGLRHLHHMSIVYRDLKPENILLDDNGHIRISDLGLAVRLSAEGLVKGRVGTVGYMAPEVVSGERYGTSPDWWGLGCLVYEMTAGRAPFRQHGERPNRSVMEKRIRGEEAHYGKTFSGEAKDLCCRLLTKDPAQRLGCQASGAAGVQAHPFFRDVRFRMLEAGLVEAPFKPDPRLVYCSDVHDIDEFSTVKGVTLDRSDEDFYNEFDTGSVPLTWQSEMIEMECFKELNVFGPSGSRSPDLDWSGPPRPANPKHKKHKCNHMSLWKRLFPKQHLRGSVQASSVPSEESLEKVGLLTTLL